MEKTLDKPKKISDIKIYFKALRFSWTRIPRAIFGFIAYLFVILLGTVLIGLWPDAEVWISRLSLIAGFFLSSYISGKHKQVYKAALVALVTQGLRKGTLPKNSYREALKDVKERFESSTIMQLVKGSLKTVFMRAFRKKIRSEIIVERGRSIVADARAMVVLYAGNMIPYLGQCVLAYNFDHPDEPMLKASSDGIEVFVKNFNDMIKRIIRVLLVEIAICAACAAVLLIPLLKFTLGHQDLSSEMMEQVDFGTIVKNGETMSIALALAITYLFLSALLYLIRPGGTIGVLRKYFYCCDTRPSEGRIYKLLPSVVKKEAERKVQANLEVERKWLVDPKKIPYDLREYDKLHLIQNYVSFDPTTRIRNVNDGEQYILTIKAKRDGVGKYSHEEYEFEINEKDYYRMVKRVVGYTVDKDRYLLDDGTGREIEFDIFHGVHEGLAYYETDFATSNEAAAYIPPDYVGKEVTHDRRYNNSSLARYGKIPDEDGEEVAQ